MKLTLDGIKDRQAWEKAGIKLPGYDVEAVFEISKRFCFLEKDMYAISGK